jgi:nucleotidyltransferase substrate binding protein (TIGR01987 family)
MEEQDIRWKQRFMNYEKALNQLTEGIENYGVNPSNIIKEGIIQRFEFTHELAWKVMKDFLEYEGFQNIMGSRSATKEAFNKDLIVEGEVWMDMIKSRNETVHTYQEKILESEYNKIVNVYYHQLILFQQKMKSFL